MKRIIVIFAVIALSLLSLSSCSKGKLVGTLIVRFEKPVEEDTEVKIYPYVSVDPNKQTYTIDRITIKKRGTVAEFILNAGDYFVWTREKSRGVQVHVGKITEIVIDNKQ